MCSDEAVEVSKVDDMSLLETAGENLPVFQANRGDESFTSADAEESLSCAKEKKKEKIEQLQNIRSKQKQRLSDRNRQIRGLRQENRKLKKVRYNCMIMWKQ